MPRPITFKLGPFTGGMLLNLAEHLVPVSHATIANDLDNTQGTLKGLYGYGTTVDTTILNPPGSVVWVPVTGWVENNYNEFVCYDTPLASGSGNPVVYVTSQGSVPLLHSGASSYDLGIDPPTVQPTVSDGASGGVRAYSITLKNSVTGWESNPLTVTDTTTNCTGAVIDLTPYTVTEVGVDKIVIYGTTAGTTTGTKYYLTEVALGVDFTDNATTYPGVVASPLNWLSGGNPDNEDFPFDHSPAPSLNVISDAVHAFAEGLDTFGQGILFGAVGSWLTWSMAGYPAYWPTTNWQKFDSNIEAIISDVGVTFVFTETDIYAVSGTDDTSLTPRKTGAAFSVRPGAGHTVKRTPFGIMFLGPLGVAVFDGESCRYLDDKMAIYSTFDEDDTFEAVYHDQYYWLLNKTQGILSYFDLSAWPNVQFFQSVAFSGTLTNLAYTPIHTTPGLYIVESGNIRPWMPRRGLEIAGASRQNFAYESPKLTVGSLNQETRFIRFWLNKTGTVEVNFYVDGTLVHTASGSDWLPKTAIGKAIQAAIASVNDVTTEVFELTIEAEVWDG